jgi:hypothetical protein
MSRGFKFFCRGAISERYLIIHNTEKLSTIEANKNVLQGGKGKWEKC